MNDTQAFPLRLPTGTHARLRLLAYRTGASMNALIVSAVEDKLGKEISLRIGTIITSPSGLYEASVIVNGTPQQLYRTPDGQVFVAGRPGASYALRVRNLRTGRIEVITSVDGRNTLKDEAASSAANTGLVMGSYSSYDFAGFRQNDSEVSRFVFCDPGKAVATQATGSTENVGVIGIAAYREREHRPFFGAVRTGGASAGDDWTPPVTYRSGSKGLSLGSSAGFETRGLSANTYDSAPVAMAGPMAQGLGTGMGETVSDRVGRTSFTREGPADIVEIRYNTEENLRAAGIIGSLEETGPRAFPADDTGYSKYERV